MRTERRFGMNECLGGERAERWWREQKKKTEKEKKTYEFPVHVYAIT